MHLDVVTPEKKLISEEVEEIIIPTSTGQITILPHHANLLTRIEPGEMIVKMKGKEQFLAIAGGFLEVGNNKISVLADYAVKAEEIEIEKALAAEKRAKEILKKTKEGIGEKDFAIAEADLRKALLQLHVANRRRKRTTI